MRALVVDCRPTGAPAGLLPVLLAETADALVAEYALAHGRVPALLVAALHGASTLSIAVRPGAPLASAVRAIAALRRYAATDGTAALSFADTVAAIADVLLPLFAPDERPRIAYFCPHDRLSFDHTRDAPVVDRFRRASASLDVLLCPTPPDGALPDGARAAVALARRELAQYLSVTVIAPSGPAAFSAPAAAELLRCAVVTVPRVPVALKLSSTLSLRADLVPTSAAPSALALRRAVLCACHGALADLGADPAVVAGCARAGQPLRCACAVTGAPLSTAAGSAAVLAGFAVGSAPIVAGNSGWGAPIPTAVTDHGTLTAVKRVPAASLHVGIIAGQPLAVLQSPLDAVAEEGQPFAGRLATLASALQLSEQALVLSGSVGASERAASLRACTGLGDGRPGAAPLLPAFWGLLAAAPGGPGPSLFLVPLADRAGLLPTQTEAARGLGPPREDPVVQAAVAGLPAADAFSPWDADCGLGAAALALAANLQ
jgi:hypothetical protein